MTPDSTSQLSALRLALHPLQPPRKVIRMVSVLRKKKPTLLLPFALLFVTLVLGGCNTQSAPASAATGFEFHVDPQTKQVTLLDTATEGGLRSHSDPSDTRILLPGVDIGLRDLSFQFVSSKKLLVRFRLENVTDSSGFAQPFFFTLNSASENIVRAYAPLVTAHSLGGDGVLSPDEQSARFRFTVTFKEGEPFNFSVDASAVVVNDNDSDGDDTACADPVDIPDASLESGVRSALDKPDGDITCADMVSLTRLIEMENRLDVADLEGLQYAVNLIDLVLYDGAISDLTPLQDLTKLTQLDLAGNAVSDLTPLQDLTNLSSIYLDANRISDLAPLQTLTNLAVLILDNNDIGDISALVGNGGLGDDDTLSLADNPLSDRALEDVETLRSRGVSVRLEL